MLLPPSWNFQYPQSGSNLCRPGRCLTRSHPSSLSVPSKRVEPLPPKTTAFEERRHRLSVTSKRVEPLPPESALVQTCAQWLSLPSKRVEPLPPESAPDIPLSEASFQYPQSGSNLCRLGKFFCKQIRIQSFS